ncbi:MAG: sterol desaturase family protein [Endozoicomonas sp.]|uniref:sterol desaturase family protein n=1 Tax=Endozoicomonas sp. TaxID=1892382 RepID=UPI003D9B993B
MSEREIIASIVSSGFILVFVIELLAGKFKESLRPWRDGGFILAGLSAHAVMSTPLIGFIAGWLVIFMFPNSSGALAETPFWLALGVIFFVQEFMHYWLHRWTHEKEWLWKIHRTHHTAEKLNTGVIWRYNVFWTLLLPQVWMLPFMIYFGLGIPCVVAGMMTFFGNMLTHTAFRWDLWLRKKMPWSEPAWRVLEKVITLPDTHHAHHAWGPGSNLNGNYATTLFIFDTVFGTAKIPNRAQKRYCLPKAKNLDWKEELFWPLIRKPEASLSSNKSKTEQKAAV